MLFLSIDRTLKTEYESNAAVEILKQLYQLEENSFFAAAHAILHDDTDAEEAVCRAFAKLCRHPEYVAGREMSAVRNLVFLMVRHQAVDLYRRNKRHPRVELEQAEQYAVTGDPAKSFETAELLSQALLALPPMYREVLLLKYAHGYENFEIAGLLGITEAAVRKRLSRARKQLREIGLQNGLLEE